jgi:hypothetical protein
MANAVFTYPSELREQTVERRHRRSRSGIVTQECILTGRITRLAIFKVPEFGTRVSFHLEYAGRPPAICAVEGNIARDFVKHCCEGDVVVVKGFHEPRPSTAAVNTPWLGRVRVRELRIAQDVLLAA